jgi:hypothetical protein
MFQLSVGEGGGALQLLQDGLHVAAHLFVNFLNPRLIVGS